MATDILSNDDEHILFANGDFAKGDSFEQEVRRVSRLNQGGLKEDPLLGPNLITLEKKKAKPEEFQRAMRLHLERDGKNFSEVKERIRLKSNER